MSKLFHRDVWFPARITRQLSCLSGVRPLVYSQHALRECRKDKYGNIPVLSELDLSKFEVFEVEEDKKKIVKFVGRFPLDETRSLVLSCIPRDGHLFVKTCWINLNSDNHHTLRRELYANP